MPPTAHPIGAPPRGLDPGRFARLMAAFERVSHAPAVRRAALAEECCGQDQSLRAELDNMLRYAEAAEDTGVLLRTGRGLSPSLVAEAGTGAPPDAADVPILKSNYRVLRQIGAGGMGVVYEAEQLMPRRTVALKALRPGSASVRALARFKREANILGRLQHPGIAQVYEAGAADLDRPGEAYIAMEFVRGRPLNECGPMSGRSVGDRLDLVARVCDAVHHAHLRRVIHRDIKPANILVGDDGQPKVLDFGVALLNDPEDADDDPVREHTGQFAGTIPYMSPEQLAGRPREVDQRCDVYALGVVLYELLSGRLPYDLRGLGVLDAAERVRAADPEPLAGAVSGPHDEVRAIVAKALEKDRDQRYQSAAELAADIRRFISGEPILARQNSAMYVLRKRLRKYQTFAAVIAVGVIVLVAFALYAWLESRREAQARLAAVEAANQAEAQSRRAAASEALAIAQLRENRIERGRLIGLAGNLEAAENILWPEHLAHGTDHSRYALWELYSKMPCRAALTGHAQVVRCIAVSPDGSLLASASEDGAIIVRDARSFEPVTVRPTAGGERGLAFVGGSARLVSAGQDGMLRVIDPRSGSESLALDVGAVPYTLAVWDSGADAWEAMIGCADGTVRWARSGSTTVDVAHDRSDGPTCVAVAPDAGLAGSGGKDGSLRLWDIRKKQSLSEQRAPPGSTVSIGISPDGSTIVTGGDTNDRGVRFWSVRSGELSLESESHWDNGTVRTVSFSRDGTRVLLGGYYRLETWDAATHRPIPNYARYSQPTNMARFSADESLIIATAEETLVRVWETRPLACLTTVEAHAGGAYGVACAPDGHTVASVGADGMVRMWDIAENGRIAPRAAWAGHTGRSRTPSFDASGRLLATCGDDQLVRVWDVRNGACASTSQRLPYGAHGCQISPDGRWVAVTCRDRYVRVYESATGTLAHTLDSEQSDSIGLAWSDDGATIASSHSGGYIALWDTGSWTRRAMVRSAQGTYSILVLSDNATVACGLWGGGVRLIDGAGSILGPLMSGHTQIVSGAAEGPTLRDPGAPGAARVLASSCADGSVKLWDPRRGICLLTLDPQTSGVMGLCFSRAGRVLVAAYRDGSIGAWDLDYYDAHIAGNRAVQAARHGAVSSAAAEVH